VCLYDSLAGKLKECLAVGGRERKWEWGGRGEEFFLNDKSGARGGVEDSSDRWCCNADVKRRPISSGLLQVTRFYAFVELTSVVC